MAGMPWIKVYTEILDDIKINRLTDAQKWRFIQLIIFAAECDADGALVTGDSLVTLDDVCFRIRCDRKELEKDIEKLIALGLITLEDEIMVITNFSERQGPTQEEKRKQWRDRQQKRRERVKILEKESPESHGGFTLKEEEEEEEEEKSKEEEEEIDSNNDGIYADLSVAFVNKTKIGELSPSPIKWYEALKKMGEAGVEPQDIENAVDILWEKDYSIVGLSSITNTAISEMSKRKGKKPDSDSEESRSRYVTGEFAEFIEH